MEENKIIEMNDEAIEVAEEVIEAGGGVNVGKVLLLTAVTLGVGYGIYKGVKFVKKKIAAKKALAAKDVIEVNDAVIVDADENSEEN